MDIIKIMRDRLFGKPVVLTVTETCIRICQGRKAVEYELPKTWQGYKYLNHAEEMANWLRAILKEETGTEKLGALGGQSLRSF